MSLKKYQAKRRFQHTPEPEALPQRTGGPLRFVVQKHHARRLHYDFRLELGGALKSWAVPKGPSLNPDDRRLAIMVEDHPLDYRHFEGIIPKGNYGAGTVMIWDEGVYCSRQSPDPAQSEKLLAEDLAKGRLTFILQGKKLQGEFALIKIKKGEPNAWLLVKKQDGFASSGDILKEDRSAVSGRTMDEISQGGVGPTKLDLDDDAPQGKMPRNVKPMLATPVDRPFDRPGWLFEIKWDGYRAIAEVEQQKVRLYSRRNLSFEERYAPIVRSLQQLGHDAVLDGEIVVVDDAGKSDFQLLQRYQQTGHGHLVYYVFDLLYLDGHDLRGLPLRRRKELLRQIVGSAPNIKLSEHMEEHGVAFFDAVAERGLEGIVAKDGNSRYREGLRSHSWLKVKTRLRQEAVIAGFTEPRGSRRHFGSLVLGVYEGDELVYIGRAGGGFDDAGLADMHARLQPLIQKQCPFKERPKTDTRAHWVKPELVCEVSFLTTTREGHIREPIFEGLRLDRPAREVQREQPEPVAKALERVAGVESPNARARPQGFAAISPGLVPKRSQRQARINIGGNIVNLTNQDKVYWPVEGYTKGDLIQYYREIALFVLPYLKDRPQSLHRHPNGIDGKSFFQKNVTQQPPDWVQTVKVHSGTREADINFLLCQDEATLVYMANLGCIELNPWSSRVGSLERPDYVVLDLDPEDMPLDALVEVALAIRKMLDKAGAASVCKTTGKRGMHIYVPLGARYDYDQARRFAEIVAKIVHHQLPALTSVARMPSQRQKRIYLDFLQNRRGQTLAAPYSVRPVPGARVSTPLHWKEVKRGLDPSKFTILTIARRLDRVGDLWRPVLGPGVNLEDCLERLSSKLGR